MKRLFCVLVLCGSLCGLKAEESLPTVSLEDFQLAGDLSNGGAAFTLTATARVEGSGPGSLVLLRGPVALTESVLEQKWHIDARNGQFIGVFDRAGKYPVKLRFAAAVRATNSWNEVEFQLPPSTLQPMRLKGLSAETQLEFSDAARPERQNSDFVTFLAGDGLVRFRWKEAQAEAEGKLFYSAEMLSEVVVSPGLLQQTSLLDFKVMQGELNQVSCWLHGTGEVTRVQGDQLLGWSVEPVPDGKDRRLVVRFNQPQRDQFALQIQTQAPLGAFPQTAEVLQLRPEAATRFSGYFRVVNEGAVRLEVTQTRGLSQIGPEQFPQTELSRTVLRGSGAQRFVYRFSGTDLLLRIQADQMLAEVNVSELLNYHLAENELSIDAEFELDIREAPLRELFLRIPRGYGVAQLHAAALSDYSLIESDNQPDAELRLLFGQPIIGRQIVQLRLEHDKSVSEAVWSLPRVEVANAKSMRGHIASSADPGFRLTPERSQGLTEIATAFFPRKVPGLESAFRLSDATWLLSVRVERLPQSIQADVLHLFSIGEGIAYGSSVINYSVSGAPVSVFQVELPEEYFNVEFTGKDVRGWQKVAGGYQVQLHTPVSGAYLLLASYERPFKAQGETLTFTGARPLGVQSEQGYTVVISAYQFQVRPAEVSAGLLPIEAGELPSEYRLLFDAPVLAAYRYATRPANLKLALSPLSQGDSLSLLADRASLETRISKEGQVLTHAKYFLKNRGNPHLRLRVPAGARLWSATVNGLSVVPVAQSDSDLIPLPQSADPNAVLNLDLRLASVSKDPKRVQVAAPILDAPVMLAQWKVEPDAGQRLVYRTGSLTPMPRGLDNFGFAQLTRLLRKSDTAGAVTAVGSSFALLALIIIALHWARGAASKLNARHITGLLLASGGLVLALIILRGLTGQLPQMESGAQRDLEFLAPVQQSGSAVSLELLNIQDQPSLLEGMASAWPVLVSLPLWVVAWYLRGRASGKLALVVAWLLLAWGALLATNGAAVFLIVIAAFVLIHLVIPLLIEAWRLPPAKPGLLISKPSPGAASAALAFLLGASICLDCSNASAKLKPSSASETAGIAQLVEQQLTITNDFGFAVANVHWRAEKGDTLPLLSTPAVPIRINYPKDSLRLEQDFGRGKSGEPGREADAPVLQRLLAKKAGLFDVEIRYEVPLIKHAAETGLFLPVQSGLVNRLRVTLLNLDMDVTSPQAVEIHRELSGSNTVAHLVLSPAGKVWVSWKPRSRDVKAETPVFYAELAQLYAPTTGLIEGEHLVSIRPAKGELSELAIDVPPGVTITDVMECNRPPPDNSGAGLISFWRFDPDARRLRVKLSTAQARPFALLIRSQVLTGPLPIQQVLGVLQVLNAAGQIGSVGLATAGDVQLDSAKPDSLSPMNLEDFSADLATNLQARISGLTLRKAFRYAQSGANLELKASAVEPEIRVESQDTVSLGEDRTVLAANAIVSITRAGIFRLSFLLPDAFDVESISGSALSHWTESKLETNRLITLHLKGKTDGQQQFALTLAGPGVKSTNGWRSPQLVLREAGKQTGTILLVPEQGLRLQVNRAEGLTQLDPQQSGIKQKGVLGFRVLQTARDLVLNVEQVQTWIRVNSLQQVTVAEAQVKVAANLQYQIENAGLKTFRVLVPTNAEGVRFQGEQLADYLATATAPTNGLQAWEVRLHRRVIGPYLLQVIYGMPVPENSTRLSVRGVQALDVNLQRGFLTLEAAGRLQVRVDSTPSALQPTEWQSIPRALQQGLPANAAHFSYRLVEAEFELPLLIERYQPAQLLAARITGATFSSVISDDGEVLTKVGLDMVPGQKRLLRLTLPSNARFWFSFVNQVGVWPWRQQDEILIPLEQAVGDKVVPVEVFYTCRFGSSSRRAIEVELLAPKFDLPLENITWRVSLNDKWQVNKWAGNLPFHNREDLPNATALDLQNYLQGEVLLRQQRTKEAEDFLSSANSALAQGDPQQARRAFQSAYSLSSHDAAFNEDARVQLHNLKLQEALVGLNMRQASGKPDALAVKLRQLRDRKVAHYTQQEAKDIIEKNSSDENSAYMRLAERLIQQQDAAVTTPAALHASIPEQGQILTFKRAVLVDPWSPLRIELKASASSEIGLAARVGILAGTFLLLLSLTWLAARSQVRAASASQAPLDPV